MDTDPGDLLPLRPVELQILASLQTGARHGYGILQEIEARAKGRGVPGMVTLYRALKRLEKRRVVERDEAFDGPGDEEAERRRRYRITKLGTKVLRAEALRLSPLVRGALEATDPGGGADTP